MELFRNLFFVFNDVSLVQGRKCCSFCCYCQNPSTLKAAKLAVALFDVNWYNYILENMDSAVFGGFSLSTAYKPARPPGGVPGSVFDRVV